MRKMSYYEAHLKDNPVPMELDEITGQETWTRQERSPAPASSQGSQCTELQGRENDTQDKRQKKEMELTETTKQNTV